MMDNPLLVIKIIYRNNNLLAINKPAGLLVHSSAHQKDSEPTLVDWLLENFPSVRNVGDDIEFRPGIIHRLDKDTSGIMLIPLDQAYFIYLKKLFQEKKIKKTYLAVAEGIIREKTGRIERPIGIKSGTVKRSVYSGKMAKEATTEYKVMQTFQKNGKKYSLLEVYPLTGRTHQIRVHLASINHPVVGDPLYGGKENAKSAPRQMLHCYALEFELRPGERVRFEADPPSDFTNFAET